MICDKCKDLFCRIRDQIDYYESVLETDKEYVDWITERLEKQQINVVVDACKITVVKCNRLNKYVT